MGSSLHLSERDRAELGIALECSDKHASAHPYWLRAAVVDSSPDGDAKRNTSIVIPALDPRGFRLRNSGVQGLHAGAKGPEGFPLHPTAPPSKTSLRRKKRAEKEARKALLNPGKIAPEAIESIMLVRRVDSKGAKTYEAALRTPMGESFKASRLSYAKRLDEADCVKIVVACPGSVRRFDRG
jgi:hypothetical protein